MAQELEVIFQLPSGNDASTDSKFRDTNKITDILLYGTSSTHWDSSADGIGFKVVRTDNNATQSTTQGLANYSGFTTILHLKHTIVLFMENLLMAMLTIL